MKKFILPILLIFSQLALIGQTTTTTYEIINFVSVCGTDVNCSIIGACTGVRHLYEGNNIKLTSASISGRTLNVAVSKCTSGSTFANDGAIGFRENTCDCFTNNLVMTPSTYSSGVTTFNVAGTLPTDFTTGDRTYYIMIDPENSTQFFRTGGVKVRATTTTSGGGGTVPAIPTITARTGTNTGEIDLDWNAVSGATYYHLYNENGVSVPNGSNLTGTSLTRTSLSGQHCYKLKACNAAGCSNLSNASCATARTNSGGGCTTPLTPTSLNAVTAASDGAITLSWSGTANSFDIEVDGNITETATSSPKMISGLIPGSRYCFRIRGNNGATCLSGWSSQDCADAGSNSGGGNTLTVNPTEISLPSTAGQQLSVNVDGNVTWEVTGACNWLTITLLNGYFTVSANSNNTAVSSRSCRLTVSGGNLTRTVDVTQDGATVTPTYTVSVTSGNGGTASVNGNNSAIFNAGVTATVIASPDAGYRFQGWYANGSLVSSNQSYPFTVNSDRDLEARFAQNVANTVQTPLISPSPQSFRNSVSVSISCSTSGATIHYTTDGSTPTINSNTYTNAFSVAVTTTVRAIGVKSSWSNSQIAETVFTKEGPIVLSNCDNCNRLTSSFTIPRQGAIHVSRRVTYQWEHELGRNIDYYRLMTYQNGQQVYSSSNIYNVTGQSVVQHTAPVLEYNTNYTWKVIAFASNGDQIGCFEKTFTTYAEPRIISDVACDPNDRHTDFGTALGSFNNVVIFKNGSCITKNNSLIYYPYGYHVSQYGYPYGWQCTEYAFRYYQQIYNMNVSGGNGRDYYKVTNTRQGFKQYKNGYTKVPPKAGDIISFDAFDKDGRINELGHVAIVREVTSNTVYLAQQNFGDNINAHLNYALSLTKDAHDNYHVKNILAGTLGWIRAEPTLIAPGDESSIETINTTTPIFQWEKHENIKGYTINIAQKNEATGCYTIINGGTVEIIGNNVGAATFPQLSPNTTYKWRVSAHFHNGASVVSRPNYFKVSNNPTGANSSSGNISQADRRSNFSVVALGSKLSGAMVSVKSDSDAEWQPIGNTDEAGILTFDLSNSFNLGDSLMIVSQTYPTIKMTIDNTILQNGRVCIPNLQNEILNGIIRPFISTVSHSNITTVPNINLKISATGMTGYYLGRIEGDSIVTYSNQDTIINVDNLEVGTNYLNFTIFNNTDTIFLHKQIFYVPDATLRQTIQIQNPYRTPIQLYVDDEFYKTLNGTENVVIMKGQSLLKFVGKGYKDKIVEIDSTISSIVLQMEGRTASNLNVNVNLNQNELQFVGGYTVLKSHTSAAVNVLRDRRNFANINLLPISETVQIIKNVANSDTLMLLSAIDEPKNYQLDSLYLLTTKVGGVYEKIFFQYFSNNYLFDTITQKLSCFGISTPNISFTLMQRQKPIRNATNLRVHQSETLTIALSDLFKDPDLLPNDMTYTPITNANFDFTIAGDSIRIRHKTCQTGNLTFRIRAEHDKLGVEDDFQIQVTPLTLTAVPTPVKCYHTATGKIFAQINSTQPLLYNYFWNNQIRIQNNDSIVKGNYLVTVTDANNCTITSSAFVTEPSDIVTAYNVVGTSCHVSNGNRLDGRATTTVTGGVGNYSYQWNQGQIVANPNNLRAGEHLLIVKDGNGCADSTRIIVPQPDSLKTTFISTIPENCDGRDGRTIISTIGGTPQYNYRWSNNETTYAPTGLARGANQVTVTDIRGCTQFAQVSIPFNDQLKIDTIRQTALPCFGDRTATATAITSGASNMTYVWSNGGRTAAISGLNVGAYTVTVTTPAGCSRTKSVTITQPTQLSIDSILKNSSPCIPKSGTAHAFVSGGVAPYRYDWSSGQALPIAVNLVSNNYVVTVTDANNCRTSQTVPMTVMPELLATTTTTMVRCFGEKNGSASVVNVSGGNGAPYRYSMDGTNFVAQSRFDSLSAGAYTMTIQDVNGCKSIRSAIVQQPAKIDVDLDNVVKILLGDSVQVFPRTTARPEFKVSILPKYNVSCDTCLNAFVKPYQKTIYTVTVQDPRNGCVNSDSMTVFVENKGEIFVPNSFSPNNDGWNDYFAPYGGRNVKRVIKMAIFARNGSEIFRAENIASNDESQGWDGKFKGSDMAVGTYIYVIEIEFFDGTTKIFTGDINLLR